ncbi:MAG: LytTR family DNA-binding domain-containing protein, partial [Oscillospiraceae bacterium]
GGEAVYAHTENDAYHVKHRLYELEAMLPAAFVRVSKSAIVNAQRIYSVEQGVTGPRLIRFAGTQKLLYASRRYYAALKARLTP